MKLGRVTGLGRDLIKHRISVVQFLDFCNKTSHGFAGSVRGEELDYLLSLVRRANDIEGPIVEIGTLYGFTTQEMALAKHPDKPMTTVDNFRWNPIGMTPEAHRDFALRVLHHVCHRANTTVFEGANTQYYAQQDDRPSMIFIDAGHSYDDVMIDIRWACERGIPIISGHDYAPGQPGVIKAVDEVFGPRVQVVGSVWAHVAEDHSPQP